MNTKAKESRKLYWAKRRLEQMGSYCILSRASLGPFDLCSLNKTGVLLVQVKCGRWASAEEEETIQLFNRCPCNTIKQVWRFDDRKQEPQVRTY